MSRVTGIRALPIIGVVFLLIGSAGLAVAGALAFVETHSGRTARAEGVVISADYRELIAFKTAQGETVRFRNSIGRAAAVEGDAIPVAYDPANPRAAAVDAFVGRWFLPGLFGILGGLFFSVGLSLGLIGWALIRRRAVQAA